jgi:hypothetical protein
VVAWLGREDDSVTKQALRRIDGVVLREVAGETFLVPVRGHLADLQELFVLNDVGRWIWDRLDGRSLVDDIASDVAAEFEVGEEQAAHDTNLFVQELAEAGLVEECLTAGV